MKLKEAIDTFEKLDKELNMRIFNKKDLRIAFPQEDDQALSQSVNRLIKQGILERLAKGVYAYKYGQSMWSYPVENLAKALRPTDFNYVSLESALSEYGVISQIPINYISIMTTGRSGIFDTPYGTIEFTHTRRRISDLMERVVSIEGRPLPLATKKAAWEDLKRVGRNLEMVDLDELALEENDSGQA